MSSRYRAFQTIRDGVALNQLADTEADVAVSVVPSHGNIAFELLHKGHNWLFSPYTSPAQMRDQTSLFGIPLLSPWANRLSSDTYTINGTQYTLNRQINNLRVDKNYLAIHGLVLFAPWTTTEVFADQQGAYATSVLSFTKNPRWMAQFPFAHTLSLTHRLRDEKLFVELSVTNESAESMPLCLGFHPYFTLPESHRESWKIKLPVRTHMVLSDLSIPTGDRKAVTDFAMFPLEGLSLDDVYTDLNRDALQHSVFCAEDGKHVLQVGFGPAYPVAVVFAPTGKDVICFEPMTAPTDAFHLAQVGKWDGLQFIAPGETWTEAFWINVAITE